VTRRDARAADRDRRRRPRFPSASSPRSRKEQAAAPS
jgi:hypothetical protein